MALTDGVYRIRELKKKSFSDINKNMVQARQLHWYRNPVVQCPLVSQSTWSSFRLIIIKLKRQQKHGPRERRRITEDNHSLGRTEIIKVRMRLRAFLLLAGCRADGGRARPRKTKTLIRACSELSNVCVTHHT